ncbi:hypothetical protein DAPPUDRAFT_111731 [Daphnia pulex]|uniref:Uncharacterized protein n=1 Tax=Daphnia pulex TaxID=6669 RepID=E9HA00_DAPPU|nr:hypothetical protein DAPPUDRAFT_111731 [Daphnia pulex]|eukprot:EFX71340.1 hypothetical protein DAPPUDRAFT_111731 [Daphnia pulex]
MAEIQTPALEIHSPSCYPLDHPLTHTEKGKHGRVWYGPGFANESSIPASLAASRFDQNSSRHLSQFLEAIGLSHYSGIRSFGEENDAECCSSILLFFHYTYDRRPTKTLPNRFRLRHHLLFDIIIYDEVTEQKGEVIRYKFIHGNVQIISTTTGSTGFEDGDWGQLPYNGK